MEGMDGTPPAADVRGYRSPENNVDRRAGRRPDPFH